MMCSLETELTITVLTRLCSYIVCIRAALRQPRGVRTCFVVLLAAPVSPYLLLNNEC
jgi:hypothetical protein